MDGASGGTGAWFIVTQTYKPLLFLILNPTLNLILIDIINYFIQCLNNFSQEEMSRNCLQELHLATIVSSLRLVVYETAVSVC